MTALDFPANPDPGLVFGRWTFDGTAWTLNPSEASLGNGIVAGPVTFAGTITANAGVDVPVPQLTLANVQLKANRTYKVHASIGWTTQLQSQPDPAGLTLRLFRGATNIFSSSCAVANRVGGVFQLPATFVFNQTVDEVATFTVVGISSTANGLIWAHGVHPMVHWIEDITPSAGGAGVLGVIPASPPVLAQGIFVNTSPINVWYQLVGNRCEFYAFVFPTATGLSAGALEFDLPPELPDMRSPVGTGNPSDYLGTLTHRGVTAPCYGKLNSLRTISVDNVLGIQVATGNPLGITGRYQFRA